MAPSSSPAQNFARSASKGIKFCDIYSGREGQPYRIVFQHCDDRVFTVQSSIVDVELDEVGVLIFEETEYEADPQSFCERVSIESRKPSVSFFSYDDLTLPSRVVVTMDTGEVLKLSADAFPYSIAIEYEDLRRGLPQFEDAEYKRRIADV